MAPRWITHDALWKALPHNESKVHLRGRKTKDRNQVNQVQRQTDGQKEENQENGKWRGN